jgi:hypothetical protein
VSWNIIIEAAAAQRWMRLRGAADDEVIALLKDFL